jgi:hypothetical protein
MATDDESQIQLLEQEFNKTMGIFDAFADFPTEKLRPLCH